MTIPQISVFLENKAGQLADITHILSENQVNMRALNIAETADYGVLRLIVDDASKASSILLEHGFILTMTPYCGCGGTRYARRLKQSARRDFRCRDGCGVYVFRVRAEGRAGVHDLPCGGYGRIGGGS